MKIVKRIVLVLGVLLVIASCIEELETEVFSETDLPDILIVEATLTDEFKQHDIKLSLLDSLVDLETDTIFNPFIPPRDVEIDLVKHESGASVQVTTSNGMTYDFFEASPGLYRSNQEFAVASDVDYQLSIRRQNGKEYSSDPMKIEGMATIGNIYAERTVSDLGTVGVGIFIDSETLSGNTGNLRFTYDETHKIIAPNWTSFQFELTNYDPCALPVPTYDLEIVERTTESRVCFSTEASQEIVQSQLDFSSGQNLERFMVRFISQDDYKIANRYSIEVQQMVSGAQAYGFYEQLDNFSRSDNLFSQIQPGLLGGNISMADGSQDGVIGFFDVVSVSKSRLFFNYDDFFEGEELPDYPVDCGLHSSPESHASYCASGLLANDCPQSIIERVDIGVISYVGVNGLNLGTCPGPYLYVATPCGDCTRLGSNVVPEFWEE
ncbi:MAG: DUF4249 domain-containing protein [Allomuricauda sp.]|nr:MAG: DUF4249 domain-containing protein [Allomuricauda sp.]